jgi:hypothetical protein
MYRVIALLLIGMNGAAATQLFDCMYSPRESSEDPEPEITTYENCGTVSDAGSLLFDNFHLANMPNRTCIFIKAKGPLGGWYYRHSEKMLQIIEVDNGCDYFVHGLVRSKVNGNFWFFNESLDVVLRTDFSHASPFYDGLAMVCREGKYVKHGEYDFLEDATCSYINTSGELIVDFLPQDKLPSREELGVPCVDLCN